MLAKLAEELADVASSGCGEEFHVHQTEQELAVKDFEMSHDQA